uniref:UPAR/Ly6 domain-containing protein n=1 Tax=Magallana gigas TaxID=29159 RepID=A0A8W8J2B1_MAGGI
MLLKVCVLLAVWSVIRTCDDVNTVACGQLDRVMNVCTDPCFSNMCQRYCGKCPLKCYHCVSTSQEDCTEIVECPNMEYACVHEKFLTNNFTVGHKRGCVHFQVCSQLYGTACHSAGECTDQRGFCCKSDLCNRNTTSQRASRDVHTQTSNIHQKRGCDTLQESLSHVLGRSDSIDITVQGHCCSGNLCNQVKPGQ